MLSARHRATVRTRTATAEDRDEDAEHRVARLAEVDEGDVSIDGERIRHVEIGRHGEDQEAEHRAHHEHRQEQADHAREARHWSRPVG